MICIYSGIENRNHYVLSGKPSWFIGTDGFHAPRNAIGKSVLGLSNLQRGNQSQWYLPADGFNIRILPEFACVLSVNLINLNSDGWLDLSFRTETEVPISSLGSNTT